MKRITYNSSIWWNVSKCSNAVVASNGPVEVLPGNHWQPRGSQRYDMPNPAKQIVLGATLLVGITMVANADPLPRAGDKSAASDAGMPSGAKSRRIFYAQPESLGFHTPSPTAVARAHA